MTDLDYRLETALDILERGLAVDDDRNVEEFRERHPERVLAIDAMRKILAKHYHTRSARETRPGYCGNCDDRFYPCATVEIIANALGVPIDD